MRHLRLAFSLSLLPMYVACGGGSEEFKHSGESLIDLERYDCTIALTPQRERIYRELLQKHQIPFLVDEIGATCVERRYGDAIQVVRSERHERIAAEEVDHPETQAPEWNWNGVYPFKELSQATQMAAFLETQNIRHWQGRDMDKYPVAWKTETDDQRLLANEYLQTLIEGENKQ